MHKFFYILQIAIPARVRRWLKLITDLQEWLKYPFVEKHVRHLECVREAATFSIGEFPAGNFKWARQNGGFEPRYTYELGNVEVVPRTGLVAFDGWTIAESIGDHFDAAVWTVGYKLARPFVKLFGRFKTIDASKDKPYIFLRKDGYYHFVIEVLVEALYALKVCPDACLLIRREDYNGFLQEYVKLLIAKGVVKEYELIDAEIVATPRLIMTAAELDSGMFCSATIEMLRDSFMPKGVHNANRRIFLTRKGRRRFNNQVELENVAREIGLEVVDTDGMPLSEQIALFSEAALVVANHGAGLTNMIFATEGAIVFELFSAKWLNDCYFRMADLCHLKYHCIVSNNEGEWGDIDIEKFKGLVDELIQSAVIN